MEVDRLDHLVLTVRDLDMTCRFYMDILGMDVVEFGEGRKALVFGNQKINLHEQGQEFDPHASRPTPGSADLCFLTSMPLTSVLEDLQQKGVKILDGPVRRTGGTGPILSLYIHDPDGNLIEVANPITSTVKQDYET